MEKTIVTGLLVFSLVMTASCGGGGGGGGGTPGTTQPTTAVIKIATQGTPSNSPISGVQAVLHLPAGVSVKAAQSAQTDTGVVAASGNAAGAELVLGTYSAANNSVSLSVVKSTGFAAGEFVTVDCDIAAGSFPISADFNVSDLAAFDANGAVVTGLTVTFSATIN